MPARINLPTPRKKFDFALMKALEQRRSVRKWKADPISDKDLSNLLLAAIVKPACKHIKMRDKKLIAEHSGGSLKKEHHRLFMKWAVLCAGNVLPLFGEVIDERLINALSIAKEWADGNTSAGRAMKASLSAHAAAREAASPVSVAVARSVGHAAATAHMADHSIGAAIYALKAVKIAGQSVDAERKWQNEHLPSEIMEMVLALRAAKEGSEHRLA